MCGICGWVDWRGRADSGPVASMCAALENRGPDSSGLWRDQRGIAVLGHRRLKVLDTSDLAEQPMVGSAGRVLVYNGEVYSFNEIRRELEKAGREFASSGDTEVVLAALEHWGTRALSRFNGMFALAEWSPEDRRLLLARDRFGIKPLYWVRTGGGLVFASELGALLRHPEVAREPEPAAVARWLQLGYSPSGSMISSVQQLAPGHLLEAVDGTITVRPWYDLLSERPAPGCTGPDEAAEELAALLRDAVGARLISDVPLGCFLSAGVDSTSVCAAARDAGAEPETLTVRFNDGVDESQGAAETARRLGLGHRIVDCTHAEMIALFERWTTVASDPLADPSLAPTFLVSAAARAQWTVALSGDGGDELLSGYPRLRLMPRLWPVLNSPAFVGTLVSKAAPPRRWAAKLEAALTAGGEWQAYQALQGVWPLAEVRRLMPDVDVDLAFDDGLLARLADQPRWRRYRLLDLHTFLPARMLAKVDRASMANSLEVRVPLLDHRIVEFLLGLPPRWANKGLLRAAAARLGAPPSPKGKRGFEVPLGAWLRGPLREVVGDWLFGPEPGQIGIDPAVVRRHWDEHQSGRRNHGERLFAVAVFARWLRGLAS